MNIKTLLCRAGFATLFLLIGAYFVWAIFLLNLSPPKIWVGSVFIIASIALILKSGDISNRLLFFVGAVIFLGWWHTAKTIPVSDFLGFYMEAKAFSVSPSLLVWAHSKNPVSSFYYSFFVFVLGDDYSSTILASIFLWALQAVFLRLLLLEVGLSRSLSGGGAIFYLLSPGVIGFSTVVSSESVFIFLLLASTLAGLRMLKSGDLNHALALGVCAGFSHLTRGNALFYLWPIFLTLPINPFNIEKSRLLKSICATIIAAASILCLQLYANYTYNNSPSFSPSKWGTYNLLAGTNIKYNGGWNRDDLALAGYDKAVSSSDFKKANEKAIKIIKDRVLSNPFAFFDFAMTSKLKRLWPNRNETLDWSLTNPESKPSSYFVSILNNFYQSWIAIVFVMAFISSVYVVIRVFRNGVKLIFDNPGLVVGAGAILSNLILHVFLEVQGRYHLPLYSFLLIFAGASFSLWSHRFRRHLKS